MSGGYDMSECEQAFLEARDLSVDYVTRGERRAVVHGASLSLRKGEIVALVGESGSGKTTLAHAIAGLLPPNASISSGVLRIGPHVIRRQDDPEWSLVRGRRVGFVPQDPGISLNPVHRVGEQIAEAARINRNLRGREAHELAIALLAEVGINPPALRAGQFPHELSGGMRQRVLIAIALACQSQVIVADEPTSALDATVQKAVLDTLCALVSRHGRAMLIVTHDLGVAMSRADRVLVMKDGRIVEEGTPEEVFAAPKHAYTRQLIDAVPAFSSVTRARGRISLLKPTRNDGSSGEMLLDIQNVGVRFVSRVNGVRHEIDALKSLSISVGSGETVAVVGESGCGKSTLARTVARLQSPTAGQVRFDGRDVHRLQGQEIKSFYQSLQFVHQNPYTSLDPRFTIGDIIDEPLRNFTPGNRAERARRVDELLELVALPKSFRDRYPVELSGGQRQRVAIARALACRPRLVILDEPVSALDVSIQSQILELLQQLQHELGLSYLFITHDLAVVRQIADRIVVMHQGAVIEEGETGIVMSAPRHGHTRELLDAVPAFSI